MRPVVGGTPRGKDFFPRAEIINKIYRRLETSHVYLSAPRRVGKTAIMRYLEDNPKDGYEFKYIITQALAASEDYYKLLLEYTNEFKSLGQTSRDMIRTFLKSVKKIGVFGSEFEVQLASPTYFEECKRIFSSLNANGKKLVLMVDEFAQAVDNIAKKEGPGEAEKFLYGNRILQEVASSNIRFIYTGSLGLEFLCIKLNALDSLNKLNTIEVGPLSHDSGVGLCKKILNYAEVPYTAEVIEHLLKGVHCLIPFHIQLVLQGLIDWHDESQEPLTNHIVDAVLVNITDRRSNHYFEHYHNHIKIAFLGEGNKYPFTRALLKKLCEKESISRNDINELALQFGESENINNILEILEYDGYIYGDYTKSPTEYRFTSPIIRRWWCRNMS